MGWPEEIVLVRHAESEGNALAADQRGTLPIPNHQFKLTERGRAQAAITAAYLRERYPNGFDTYYCSHYHRVQETMRILYPEAKLYEDPRLAEGNRGIFSNMSAAEIAERYPHEEARKVKEGLYDYRPIGGESWPDVELRIHSFLGTLARDCEGERVLMVVHGFWLHLWRRLVERIPVAQSVETYGGNVVENASVTVYARQIVDGKQRLIRQALGVVPWQGQL
ncbi:MAG TPA: histidine phosphatase family protein [Acidimicrobiia bacterium]|jgi:broad specificity phosphatase PhoE|nr:histidine phosphatase family protein [Acidimicrobiia bacterium]